MSYNFKKTTCDDCGKKKPPKIIGMMRDPDGSYPNSFRLGQNGEVWCPECHKEKMLAELFDQMDKRESNRKV